MAKSYLMKRIEEIMDLTGEAAQQEAAKKLLNTVMIINGELKFVTEFFYNSNEIRCYNYDQLTNGNIPLNETITSIDVFLPEAGNYKYRGGEILYLTKNPKKQWSKSFCEAGYLLYGVTAGARSANIVGLSWKEIMRLDSFDRVNISVDEKKNIFHHDIFIGRIENKDKRIICNNSLFQQELKDWVRDDYKRQVTS